VSFLISVGYKRLLAVTIKISRKVPIVHLCKGYTILAVEFVLFTNVCATISHQSQTAAPNGNAITIRYVLHIPDSCDPSIEYPVDLFFHGYTRRSADSSMLQAMGDDVVLTAVGWWEQMT